MNKFILSLSLFFASVFCVTAQSKTDKQDKKINHRVVLGLHIGALSPVPLPDNIRKVKSYSPLISPGAGYEGTYSFTKKWALGVGAQIDFKSMSVKDSVIYFHTLVQMGDGSQTSSFEGAFSGINYTKARNVYLTFPVFAQFTPNEKWHYKLGGYMAFLLSRKFEGYVADGYIRNGGSLGEKVEITKAFFDFSDHQNKFDIGIHAGAARNISSRWQATVNLQWGLRNVFPSSFTGITFPMYNIFGTLGASYKL